MKNTINNLRNTLSDLLRVGESREKLNELSSRLDRPQAFKLYWIQSKTVREIAIIYSCSTQTVSRLLKKYVIPRRNYKGEHTPDVKGINFIEVNWETIL